MKHQEGEEEFEAERHAEDSEERREVGLTGATASAMPFGPLDKCQCDGDDERKKSGGGEEEYGAKVAARDSRMRRRNG